MEDYFSELPILGKIDELKDVISSLRPLSKEQENRIMQKFRLDWNYHSNAIEGNSLDFGETHAFLMYGLTAKGKPFKDYLDVRGHNDAINYILSLVQSKEILTEKDIRGLHSMLLVESYDSPAETPDGLSIKKRVHLGEYKRLPNSVKTITGEMHHYATPEETPSLMENLMTWYKRTLEVQDLHPVVFAALFHHKFVSIHPFDDGNGRMSRLLMNLILMKFHYPPVVIKESSKNEYYLQLSQADTGKVIPFIEFIAKQMIMALELYIKGARGESLEEPSDLDMKLALFRKEIDGQPDKIELKKSEEVLNEVKGKSINPLINEIKIVLAKFNTFFLNNSAGYLYFKKSDNLLPNKWVYEAVDTDKLIEEYFSSTKNEYLILYFLYDQFKRSENTFSIEIKLVLKFSELKYEIFLSPSMSGELKKLKVYGLYFWLPKRVIEKYYHQSISCDERNDITTKVGNDVYNMMVQLHEMNRNSLSDLLDNKIFDYWNEFKDLALEKNDIQLDNIENFVINNNHISIVINIDSFIFGIESKKFVGIAEAFSVFLRNKIDRYDLLNIEFALPFEEPPF